mmetsp:Transcript_25093/g.77371  ORF Transcript_25093/g.77371 Transcript_25093/m.77371 type:complete len:210 (+) Transcript_25093:768-1397(+)
MPSASTRPRPETTTVARAPSPKKSTGSGRPGTRAPASGRGWRASTARRTRRLKSASSRASSRTPYLTPRSGISTDARRRGVPKPLCGTFVRLSTTPTPASTAWTGGPSFSAPTSSRTASRTSAATVPPSSWPTRTSARETSRRRGSSRIRACPFRAPASWSRTRAATTLISMEASTATLLIASSSPGTTFRSSASRAVRSRPEDRCPTI